MKKLFALLIILVCLNTKAQTNVYHPFPDTNGVWRINHQSGSNCYIGPPNYNALYEEYQYTLGNDTIMGSYTYKQVYRSGNYGICWGSPNYFYGYAGGLRQDTINKKVYFKYVNQNNEILLYDFTLQVGDTIKTVSAGGTTYTISVYSIDSILVDNNYHKRFNINPASPGGSIIEGVGATAGLLEAMYMMVASEETYSLICFSSSLNNYPNSSCPLITNTAGIQQLSNIEQVTIYPNPSNGSFQVTVSNEQVAEIKIYDVAGKLVLSKSLTPALSKGEGVVAIVDASALNEGVYNISILSNQGTANKKLVIIK